MPFRRAVRMTVIALLTVGLMGDEATAQRGGGRGGGGFRGGGGGYRGGGGGYRSSAPSRPSYSSHGSIRYSSPRPSSSSYRGSTPGSARRSATGSPSRGAGARVSAPIYRPPNSGSIGRGGTITGARGGGAGGISGPRGGAAGAAWGPDGNRIAGARGPRGGRAIAALPPGAVHYPWRGDDFWHDGYRWWRPCWIGDGVYYDWVYPPIGYYYPALPEDYETTVIDDTTYYESDDVYYTEGEQDGQEGYVVAEAPKTASQASESGDINPFDILQRMCRYVSERETFLAVAETTNDQIGADGVRVQVSSRRKLHVKRPDLVAVDVTGDTGARRIVYDGKAVSMLDRKQHYYSIIPVPGTIDTALDKLAQDYGIVVPLEDLMYTDLYERMIARVSTGQYLGLHKVGSHECHHLVFAAGTSNWELWVQEGDQPIPRKLSIDYGRGADRARYSATMIGWNSSPSFDEDTFEFKVPESAKQLEPAPN